jgi:hypothetical protein
MRWNSGLPKAVASASVDSRTATFILPPNIGVCGMDRGQARAVASRAKAATMTVTRT